MILNTLVYIYGFVLLMSTAATFFAWLKFRHKMIRHLLNFWLSGIVAFFAQGVFNQVDEWGLLAFGTNIISIYFGLVLFADAISSKKKLKYEFLVSLVCLIIGFLVTHYTGHFFYGALIFCLGCAFSAMHAVLTYESGLIIGSLNKGFRWFLILGAFHFLDYPFLRTNENLAVLGFSISLILHFCFAIYVPILIMQKMSSEYVAKLEEEVQQRTVELSDSNQKLKETFVQLKQNKEKVDTLLRDTQIRMSTLVHDLANPLQVLTLNMEVMSVRRDNRMELFEQKSARLNKSIESIMNILTEARKTHTEIMGKSELSKTEVNVHQLINDILCDFEERLSAKNIKTELDFLDGESLIWVHETWLRNQVLANLISNAIKFSFKNSKIKITVRFPEADKVRIVIEDYGIGISVDKAQNIFSLGHQTTTKGTSGEKGTGLGLPIVKQYVELMGGTVCLLDRDMPGAAFQIDLPRGG